MKNFRQLILFILLLVLSITTKATHINGGYISYKHLSGNTYEITLVVYRDCFNGVPSFDNPACIGVFNQNNTIVQTLNVPVAPDSVYLFTPGDCIPTNLCFVKAHYTFPLTLPTSGIFTVTYERCCRTSLIQNLQTPSSYGMSFFTSINNNVQNNSAEFNTEIPGYAFVGDNFLYDASANDLDNDSLVYSLDNCYNGADTLDPQPCPANNPPYSITTWQVPYSLSNILGGSVPLSINPTTGIMTATPGTIGVFQVAEKVDEYRNGTLINTHRREFQIFVSPANYYFMNGNVSADNNTQPLDTGKLWMIRQNFYDSTLTAIDTSVVLNGVYNFPSAINGYYLAKASADSTSLFYLNNIPTYYGDSLFWYQATPLNLCNGNLAAVDIHLVQGINLGGPGFVGGLISQGANKLMSPGDPESGITIILFDSNNQPVAYGITDATGNFSIGNLPLGTYKVYVDKLNWLVDNSLAPTVTLTASAPNQNNLSFTLFTDRLELNGFVNTYANSLLQNYFSVFPNPTSDKTTFRFSLSENSDVKVMITDIAGREINSFVFLNQTKGIHENEISLSKEKMSRGIYFVNFKTKSDSKSLRLVIL